MEDTEFGRAPASNVYNEMDYPYAMVPETQSQPSASTTLPTHPPQVAPLSQYFLLMDVNGVLLATYYGQIGKEKAMSHHTRVRDGNKEFLLLCLSNFTVVFSSSMNSENLDRLFHTLLSHVLELGPDCLRFAQNWYDVSNYIDPQNPKRLFFLKCMACLLRDLMGLASRGTTLENTLLVDDLPYKNIKNDPYNVVHPQTFMYFTEKNMKKPYLLQQLWPFFQGLKDSGLPVPMYCRQHRAFGNQRLFLGDEEYERFATIRPRDQRGFEVPYVGLPMLGAPYTNVGGPSDL
jgi:hypothetical protein